MPAKSISPPKTRNKQSIFTLLFPPEIFSGDHTYGQSFDKKIYVATIPNHLKLLEDSA